MSPVLRTGSWGLRDYGTGQWDGGDPDCDHRHETAHQKQGASSQRAGRTNTDEQRNENFRDVCGKCGAVRVDRQLGLEKTPQEYVANLVAVFREVRRVLAPHGTVWLNLGDSYAADRSYQVSQTRNPNHDFGKSNATRVPVGLKPKDLVGIPWRVAFALQADGWYLRSDIVWSKPNPMPESVTDRPTKSHEYVFLLSKGPRYFFDQEAVREPHESTRWGGRYHTQNPNGKYTPDSDVRIAAASKARVDRPDFDHYPHEGRNIRSVWEIATQPYPEAHFATFPEELPRRAIKASCPEWVCGTCGKARERIVEVERPAEQTDRIKHLAAAQGAGSPNGVGGTSSTTFGTSGPIKTTLGFTDCGHGDYRPGIVLDPFAGAGTTALVARKLGRHAVGIELNPDYCALIANRLQQLSLLA